MEWCCRLKRSKLRNKSRGSTWLSTPIRSVNETKTAIYLQAQANASSLRSSSASLRFVPQTDPSSGKRVVIYSEFQKKTTNQVGGPLLWGWRPSLLGWRPSLLGVEAIAIGFPKDLGTKWLVRALRQGSVSYHAKVSRKLLEASLKNPSCKKLQTVFNNLRCFNIYIYITVSTAKRILC